MRQRRLAQHSRELWVTDPNLYHRAQVAWSRGGDFPCKSYDLGSTTKIVQADSPTYWAFSRLFRDPTSGKTTFRVGFYSREAGGTLSFQTDVCVFGASSTENLDDLFCYVEAQS